MSTIKVDTIATRTGSGNITASNTIAGTNITASGTLGVTGLTSLSGNVNVGSDDDINMSNASTGQIHIDGNGYSGAIALNASGMNIYTNSASRPLIFGVNETEVCRITTGGLAIGGTGAANTLDDYEEGTWTLTDTSGAGLSITVYVATYTKIGNQVFFEFGIVFPTTSNGNDLKLSLPFTAKSSADNTGGGGITVNSSGRNDTLVVIRNQTNMAVQNNLNQSATNANYSGKQLRAAGQYTVA